MSDIALDKFIKKIEGEYDYLMTENDVCELLGFNKIYFCRMRKSGILIPFLKIGYRIVYLKDDVIEFIKKNRMK